MSDMDDLFGYEMMNEESDGSGSGGGSSGGGSGFGCGWFVIVIVVILLIYFISTGADWDAIDTLLAFGLLAFLYARWISK